MPNSVTPKGVEHRRSPKSSSALSHNSQDSQNQADRRRSDRIGPILRKVRIMRRPVALLPAKELALTAPPAYSAWQVESSASDRQQRQRLSEPVPKLVKSFI